MSAALPLSLRLRLAIGRWLWRLVMPGYQQAMFLTRPGVPGHSRYKADCCRVIHGIEIQLGVNATDAFLFNTDGESADRSGA